MPVLSLWEMALLIFESGKAAHRSCNPQVAASGILIGIPLKVNCVVLGPMAP
jgi:hypothetical protein